MCNIDFCKKHVRDCQGTSMSNVKESLKVKWKDSQENPLHIDCQAAPQVGLANLVPLAHWKVNKGDKLPSPCAMPTSGNQTENRTVENRNFLPKDSQAPRGLWCLWLLDCIASETKTNRICGDMMEISWTTKSCQIDVHWLAHVPAPWPRTRSLHCHDLHWQPCDPQKAALDSFKIRLHLCLGSRELRVALPFQLPTLMCWPFFVCWKNRNYTLKNFMMQTYTSDSVTYTT